MFFASLYYTVRHKKEAPRKIFIIWSRIKQCQRNSWNL